MLLLPCVPRNKIVPVPRFAIRVDFRFMGAHVVVMNIAPLYAAKALVNEGYSNSAATVIATLLAGPVDDEIGGIGDIDLNDLASVPSRFAEYRTKKDAVSAHGPDVVIACGVQRECVIVDLSPPVAAVA
mgnify:CR=1 FL=1